MKRIFHIALCIALMGSCDAHAVGGIAEVTIFDRDTGAALKPYFYRGEYWVAGTPGTRYALQIRNRLGQRLLAVTAVDGLNVLSGALAGWDQAGYVFNPGERYQISGWRKSDAEVAAFTFTDARNSYADRTGRPANVGVIGVALFRERQPQQVPYESAPSSGAAPSSDDSAARAQTAPLASQPAPAPKLGTGHGEREYSYVAHTVFLRMQPQPDEVIRIRYDSFDNLVAMGVIRQTRPQSPVPDPFPASPGEQYVPDPPG